MTAQVSAEPRATAVIRGLDDGAASRSPAQRVAIASVMDLGLLVRAVRRSGRRPMEDVAEQANVGHVFVRDVEHGKDTVQLGRVLRVLQELNIPLEIAIPPEAVAELQRLQQTGLRPRKTRRQQRAQEPAST